MKLAQIVHHLTWLIFEKVFFYLWIWIYVCLYVSDYEDGIENVSVHEGKTYRPAQKVDVGNTFFDGEKYLIKQYLIPIPNC